MAPQQKKKMPPTTSSTTNTRADIRRNANANTHVHAGKNPLLNAPAHGPVPVTLPAPKRSNSQTEDNLPVVPNNTLVNSPTNSPSLSTPLLAFESAPASSNQDGKKEGEGEGDAVAVAGCGGDGEREDDEGHDEDEDVHAELSHMDLSPPSPCVFSLGEGRKGVDEGVSGGRGKEEVRLRKGMGEGIARLISKMGLQ